MKENDRNREGWVAEELGEQSSYEDTTEMKRRIRRGNETKGEPDERDVAGAISIEESHEARDNQSTLEPIAQDVPARE